VIFNQTHDLLHNAVAALVTSGTATLETALMSVPQVVCYKSSWLSFQIARRIVDVKYISLVNLIMDKEVVKELIQNDLNRENLIHELNLLFDDSNRARMLSDYSQLRLKLGGEGASATAAKMMIARLNSKE
ncbi:MAG TPA: lipid-A-disaccharide synthase, partial [Bacteroidales bacterium]|nr:lipid-A-disaccharide synthase [Bacteroidales bacterium]